VRHREPLESPFPTVRARAGTAGRGRPGADDQGDWCSGNTAVSKTAARGSTPRSPASVQAPDFRGFWLSRAASRLPWLRADFPHRSAGIRSAWVVSVPTTVPRAILGRPRPGGVERLGAVLLALGLAERIDAPVAPAVRAPAFDEERDPELGARNVRAVATPAIEQADHVRQILNAGEFPVVNASGRIRRSETSGCVVVLGFAMGQGRHWQAAKLAAAVRPRAHACAAVCRPLLWRWRAPPRSASGD
jgi:hypothetical protein